ncbi:MAG: sugar phosphate isomerase/epimerase [Litorilinea sp.]
MSTAPIALQLYTLRFVSESMDAILAHAAAAGYRGVETAGTKGLAAAELADLLQKHSLEAASMHTGVAALAEDVAGQIAYAQALDCGYLTISSIPQDARPTDAAGWQALGQQFGEYGAACAQAGIRLCYHNHDFEFARVEGRYALEWMLDAAPDTLHWQPDLAWVTRGHADPLAMLEQYAGRCPLIHVKDLHPNGQGEDEKGFADVGYGIMDWDALLPAAAKAGAVWYIVEHDLPAEPIRTIQRSYTYLAEKLG